MFLETQILLKILYFHSYCSYGLLGSSGCGKTTILGCIVGRKNFQHGEIRLFGKKINGVPGDKIGYMPQVSISYETSEKSILEGFLILGNSTRG